MRSNAQSEDKVNVPLLKCKYEKLALYHELMKEFSEWACNTTEKTSKKLKEVSGKPGRQEEATFWKNLLDRAGVVNEQVTTKFKDAEKLFKRFEEVFGSTRKEKAMNRKKTKLVRKVVKAQRSMPVKKSTILPIIRAIRVVNKQKGCYEPPKPIWRGTWEKYMHTGLF